MNENMWFIEKMEKLLLKIQDTYRIGILEQMYPIGIRSCGVKYIIDSPEHLNVLADKIARYTDYLAEDLKHKVN